LLQVRDTHLVTDEEDIKESKETKEKKRAAETKRCVSRDHLLLLLNAHFCPC
jgi:hypothetical protein